MLSSSHMRKFITLYVLLFTLVSCATTSTPPPPTTTLAPTPIPTQAVSPTQTRPMPTKTPNTQSPNLESLISKMSIEQKVGQVMMVGFDGTTLTPELAQEIQDLHLGGIVFFERNVDSPRAVAEMTNAMQRVARDNQLPGLFISIDQEGGIVTRLREAKGFTEFPSAMAIGATGDANNARRVAQQIGNELKAVGINMDLAPDLDVNNNPTNPVISTRSFGSDPARVAEFGVAYLEGLESAGIAAIGKHFPGHGDTGTDSHISLPTVPHNRARLEAVEFVPFKAAIQANITGIMSAHVTFPTIDPTPSLAATLSKPVLTDLLRNEMKFDGLILTDSLEMGALATSGYLPPIAAATALKSGADIVLVNHGTELHRQMHATIVDWVKRGLIPQSRLDDAVRRMLLAKARFNLLTPPQVDANAASQRTGTDTTLAFSRDIAAHAVTLVRDQAKLLPLKSDAKLLVVETAANIGLGNRLGATTMQINTQPKQTEIDSVLKIAEGRTVIVVTTDVAKNPTQANLVNTLVKEKIAIIVVAVRSPYDILSFPNAPTYLASYGFNPPLIEAVTSILVGKNLAQGKLPVEITGIEK
jgi:beta-N-acetylhexosaminidase